MQKLRIRARFFSSSASVVCLDYNDLKAGVDLTSQIEQAYGFDGVGLLTVSGVPNLLPLRERLLRLGYEFANLPESVKAKYEHFPSGYAFGWSQGKETLEECDKFKGSFYANPQYDTVTDDAALIKEYPSYCSPNIWPQEDMPELQQAFKELGCLIVDTGTLVAQQCDAYVARNLDSYSGARLSEIIAGSKTCKARLLHYYAQGDDLKPDSASSWCGWHNDHGALTGLTSALFLTPEGQEVSNPDPKAGLHIKDRAGGIQRLTYPASSLAFQIGEAAQILSGGLLQATPHAVQGPATAEAAHLSRTTLAVFMQPMWYETMDVPVGGTVADACRGSTHQFLPAGMPPLSERWNPGDSFGDFTNATITKYHDFAFLEPK